MRQIREMLSLLITLICVRALLGATPATHEAAPDGQPVRLAGGMVEFYPPDGWIAARGVTDSVRTYELDKTTVLRVTVLPVNTNVTAASGSDLLKSLQAKVSREKRPTAIAPQLESDAVCPIRIHARYKLSADGSEFADELYLYRPVGQRMVSLTLVTAVHTEQEVDAVHQTAEALLAGADLPGAAKKPAAVASTTRPAPAGLPDVNITLPSGPLHRTTKVKVAAATPAKALTLAKAKLRLPALPGWTVESTDQTSGCVAVYRDEQNKSKIIMVTVHPLPPEVRDDAAARQAVISDLVQGEQATLNLPNSQPSGKPETITDSRFLRKVRQSYDVQKIKVQVDLRSLVAGDAVVCVVSAAQGDAADAAADTQKSADDLALGIKPVGK